MSVSCFCVFTPSPKCRNLDQRESTLALAATCRSLFRRIKFDSQGNNKLYLAYDSHVSCRQLLNLPSYCHCPLNSTDTKQLLLRPGTTLYEACETNEVELGPASHGGPSQIVHSERWTEPVFGEGPTSGYDHVVVSNVGNAAMSPMTRPERRMLEDYWDFDELFPESRLASQIKLSKEMDGMIVYVPPRVDDSNP